MKGFSPVWCKWIEEVVRQGSVGIKVNEETGHNFQTSKGLGQGDPLSPILFNLVADMLAILVLRAKNDGQFRGLVPNLFDDGMSVM
jgi:retron-type reverse transcriptase